MEGSSPVTLDDVAAEIARCEQLLARDMERVHRPGHVDAEPTAPEPAWAATGFASPGGAGADGLDEEARRLLAEHMAAARHQQLEQAQAGGPQRAWGDAPEEAQAARPGRPRPSGQQQAKPKVGAAQRPSSAPARGAAPAEGGSEKRYRHSRQELEQQAREKLARECTFKPRTAARPRSAQRRKPKAAGAVGLTRQERIDNLAKSKRTLWQKREQQRMANKEAELRQCTFEPHVNAKPPSTEGKEDAEEEGDTKRRAHSTSPSFLVDMSCQTNSVLTGVPLEAGSR